MDINNILILGTGAWGTGIAQVLSDNGKSVCMYGNCKAEVDDINNNHTNSKYFKECHLSDNIIAFNSMEAALKHLRQRLDLVIIAVPTSAVKSVLTELSQTWPRLRGETNQTLFVNLAKGYDDSNLSMHAIFREVFPQADKNLYYSLLGPSHAEEVIVRKLTCVNLIYEVKTHIHSLLSILHNDYFKVHLGYDLSKAEFCSSIKNVYALASGILAGLGYGQNARAALLTYSLFEIRQILTELYQDKNTDILYELCGIGDLVVTCYSNDSRNYTAGHKIGELNSFAEFIKDNKITVEGIRATKFIYNIMDSLGLDLIIISTMYDIITCNVNPKTAIENMFNLVNNKI